uniref:Cytochrome c6 n=1 Tax=Undaria pinnatifida TaxID=74381 RepID=A0A0R6LUL8_UNDPI|nr:cytochrome c553 [Undaria pinnatifida]AKG49943.1 cytochrome c553 [Undaria pinnatifida]UXC97014.1 cytochrome c553 [Undaria pinnatifida]UXC97152.1 cytochrome c553 [Undaria pinnatifida]UXC97290.1 cytochrome c553 [Undaria pinnatifida]
MKNFFFGFFIACLALISFQNPAQALDISNGENIFTANCSACHAGGNNVIMIDKTLKKDALDKNQMNSVSAITYQVTNGKNAMPAFGGRLSEPDIEDVANFVISKSDKWD